MTAATATRAGVVTGSGLFAVERGRTLVGRALGVLLRLPRPGDAVPVRLTITRDAGVETWARDIGGRRLVTRQHVANGRLVELVGPLRLELAPAVAGGVLTLTAVRVTVLGVPVPRAFAPRVVATVRGDAASVGVDVAMAVPFAGLLLRYGGPLAFEEC